MLVEDQMDKKEFASVEAGAKDQDTRKHRRARRLSAEEGKFNAEREGGQIEYKSIEIGEAKKDLCHFRLFAFVFSLSPAVEFVPK